MMNGDRTSLFCFCLPFIILHSAFIIEKKFPFETVEFRIVPMLSRGVGNLQGLLYCVEPLYNLSPSTVCLRKEPKVIGMSELTPDRVFRRQTAQELRRAFVRASLHRHCPTMIGGGPREHLGKAPFRR